ncbi:MAG: Asp-tRNA(Asn)/Glu-tRNA(Gln) amidotransferase subunit GatB [Eubacteriales bacterium]
MLKGYDITIGLEVHCELNTKTKVFCTCKNEFGGEPNAHTCPVCLGMPGMLPVLNKQAVEKCILAGYATNCTINDIAHMDRKNYFYPDSPKAYQISQLYHPLCSEGLVKFEYTDADGSLTQSQVRIERIHLEEDAGKSIHDAWGKSSLLDFNRCGVPLIEIVTYPDMTCAEQACAFFEALRARLKFAGVSDCKMQEGSLRADVNLSIKPVGSDTLGTRTEMKNLNSTKAIFRAIKAEAKRQAEELAQGKRIIQETRRWDDNKGRSLRMRSKEEANDYRYFPDPDLTPIAVDEAWKKQLRESLPEMPDEKMQKYMSEYNLPEYDSAILTSDPDISIFFESALKYTENIKSVSNFIMVDMLRIIKEKEMEFGDVCFTSEDLASLINMVDSGVINISTAKSTVLEAMFAGEGTPEGIIESKGLKQMGNEDELLTIVRQVIEENPAPVQQYKEGKEQVIGFLMGQVMKKTQGKAKPDMVMGLFKTELS